MVRIRRMRKITEKMKNNNIINNTDNNTNTSKGKTKKDTNEK